MMITARNLLAHEWIGLRVAVRKSSDPTMREIDGVVLDETKNTLMIRNRETFVRVAKFHNVFAVNLPNAQEVTVDGSLLTFRPEDRVKRGLVKR